MTDYAKTDVAAVPGYPGLEIVSAYESRLSAITDKIHNDVGQNLTALRIGLKVLQDAITDSGIENRLETLQTLSSRIAEDLQYIVAELQPITPHQEGLPTAIANYLQYWTTRHSVKVEFQSNLENHFSLGRMRDENLCRILQDALYYSVAEAQCEHIDVVLSKQGQDTVLMIEYKGRAIERSESGKKKGASSAQSEVDHMTARAKVLNGNLILDFQIASGTTIIVKVPTSQITNEFAL